MKPILVSLDAFSDHSDILSTNPFGKCVCLSDGIKNTLKKIIDNELTPLQKSIIYQYYYENKNIPQIACESGVNKSSVCRTLKRARARIGNALKYGNLNMWTEKEDF